MYELEPRKRLEKLNMKFQNSIKIKIFTLKQVGAIIAAREGDRNERGLQNADF